MRGLETYSTRFFLEWTDAQGQAHSLELTPEVYARLRGPYNRRNVYGAVLAYGPVLPARAARSGDALRARGDAPLLRELGIDPADVADPCASATSRCRAPPWRDLPRVMAP